MTKPRTHEEIAKALASRLEACNPDAMPDDWMSYAPQFCLAALREAAAAAPNDPKVLVDWYRNDAAFHRLVDSLAGQRLESEREEARRQLRLTEAALAEAQQMSAINRSGCDRALEQMETATALVEAQRAELVAERAHRERLEEAAEALLERWHSGDDECADARETLRHLILALSKAGKLPR